MIELPPGSKWVYEPQCCDNGFNCDGKLTCARDAAIRAQRDAANDEIEALGHWAVPKICIAVGLVALCFLIAERLAS
jgi:hypothetical protein